MHVAHDSVLNTLAPWARKTPTHVDGGSEIAGSPEGQQQQGKGFHIFCCASEEVHGTLTPVVTWHMSQGRRHLLSKDVWRSVPSATTSNDAGKRGMCSAYMPMNPLDGLDTVQSLADDCTCQNEARITPATTYGMAISVIPNLFDTLHRSGILV